MNILITGANGQLGLELVNFLSQKGHVVLGCSRERLDVTKWDQVSEVVWAFMPDVIVHAAAYTKVDEAESHTDLAYEINALGTRHIALAAENVGAKLCYISTDYVFDGLKGSPYGINDIPYPCNAYGRTKLAGEKFVGLLSSRYYIVRTSWVYGRHGSNFVKTMLKLAKEREELQVVADQIGSPTFTTDLARFIESLIRTDKFGVYHASNAGSCSWYEFAKAIMEEAGLDTQVVPIVTEQLPRPAMRPAYSVMDCSSIRCNGLRELRGWREALRECITQWKTTGKESMEPSLIL
jgi:dTDP-4-dehydrorhamnose reductase